MGKIKVVDVEKVLKDQKILPPRYKLPKEKPDINKSPFPHDWPVPENRLKQVEKERAKRLKRAVR